MIRSGRGAIAIALLGEVVFASGSARAAGRGHAVLEHWAIGGTGGWDDLTVDPASHRLYVSRGLHMQVIDLATGKVAGDLPGTPGIHAIALAPDLGRGFTSNGRDSSVTIFDAKSLAVVKVVPVTGRNPDAILYEPRSHRVFAMNAGSGTATAIDARTGEVVGTVALGGRPEFAVADDRGRVFVNLEDSSAVVSFDAATLALGARWPLAPGESPTGLAIDVAHRRLFAACGNRTLVVLDADLGRVVATLPTGEGTDGVTFDPGTGLAFVSNGEGTLTVVRERGADRFEVAETVATQRGARTLALDRSSHRVFLPTARFGEALPPTPERPHPRPPVIPESFEILVVGRGR